MHLGQEIYSFFNVFGREGLIGIFMATLIINACIYKVFKIIINNNINTYTEFIDYIVGSNIILRKMINKIISIFLLISFFIMVSGFATFLLQEYDVSKFYGIIIIAIITYFILNKNVEGIINANVFLVPILVLLIIILGIKNYSTSFFIIEEVRSSGWQFILKSILYASYNSIVLIPMIIGMKKYVKDTKSAKIISIFSFVIITLLAMIVYFLINSNIEQVKNIEIPIIYIAKGNGVIYKNLCAVIIASAIFTSAISAEYTFLKNTKEEKYKTMLIIISICSIFVCLFKFTNLVNLLYPLFGYLGIAQIVFLSIKY